MMRVRLIVNPRAGSGSATQRQQLAERCLRDGGCSVDVQCTRGPGDAARLVREAADHSVDCAVVVGGDGTLNEACQAYISERGDPLPGPELGLVNGGTGGDFRKTFGLGTEVAQAVRRIVDGPPRPIDLGIAELTGPEGGVVTRAFVNIASFGLSGLTDRIVNNNPKWLGGKATFFLGALRAMLAYANQPVSMLVDGKPCLEAPVLNVAIANGRYFGGGMKIAPDADPSDGLFDVIALYDLTRAQGVGLAYKIYQGTHPGSPGVRVARGAEIEARPTRPSAEVLIDLDGEMPGRLPLRIRCLPGAVRFRI